MQHQTFHANMFATNGTTHSRAKYFDFHQLFVYQAMVLLLLIIVVMITGRLKGGPV
jgi:hypothetical protein